MGLVDPLVPLGTTAADTDRIDVILRLAIPPAIAARRARRRQSVGYLWIPRPHTAEPSRRAGGWSPLPTKKRLTDWDTCPKLGQVSQSAGVVSSSGTTSSSAAAMIAAAEQLVAERGLGAVSMRMVGEAAGQRHHSAVQFHFGTWEGLLQRIAADRMGPINQQRLAMLERLDREGRGADVRGLVEALVVPLAKWTIRRPGSFCRASLAVELRRPAVVIGGGADGARRGVRLLARSARASVARVADRRAEGSC